MFGNVNEILYFFCFCLTPTVSQFRKTFLIWYLERFYHSSISLLRKCIPIQNMTWLSVWECGQHGLLPLELGWYSSRSFYFFVSSTLPASCVGCGYLRFSTECPALTQVLASVCLRVTSAVSWTLLPGRVSPDAGDGCPDSLLLVLWSRVRR